MAGYDANISLLLHFNGANGATTIIDNSPNAKTPTTPGGWDISNAQSKFGGTSGRYQGSFSSLVFASNAEFAFPGDFTVSLWLRFPSLGDIHIYGDDAGGSGFALRYDNSAKTLIVDESGIATRSSKAWSPSTNTWYNVEVARSGTSLRSFIDGTQIGTTATDSTSYAQTDVKIGNFGGSVFLDELCVSKGIARHTGNFTPATDPFFPIGRGLLKSHLLSPMRLVA